MAIALSVFHSRHATEGVDPVVEAGPPPVEAGLAKNQRSMRYLMNKS